MKIRKCVLDLECEWVRWIVRGNGRGERYDSTVSVSATANGNSIWWSMQWKHSHSTAYRKDSRQSWLEGISIADSHNYVFIRLNHYKCERINCIFIIICVFFHSLHMRLKDIQSQQLIRIVFVAFKCSRMRTIGLVTGFIIRMLIREKKDLMAT